MKRACLDCGASFTPATPLVRRCERHQGNGTGWSHGRDRTAQARFRAALLERAGGRCEEIDEDTGRRCTETRDLRACHLAALADGGTYSLANGKLRCKRHDRATDSRAR